MFLAITCSAPARIAGGTFRTVPLPNTDHQYIYQTVAMYVCLDKSHLLVGHENLTCLHTGEWDAAPPTCVGKWLGFFFFFLLFIFQHQQQHRAQTKITFSNWLTYPYNSIR